MSTRMEPVIPMAAAVYPSEGIGETEGSRSSTNKGVIDFDKIVRSMARGNQKDESRLRWLASEIIGAEARMASPFGSRRITYCDHTASGRFLWFIEEYLATQVLPFYGNTHTVDSYVGLHTSSLVKEANQYIKHCVGAGPNVSLLYCGSGSTAAIKRLQEVMAITSPPPLRRYLLGAIPPTERWVVFLGPHEHHSNLLSWQQTIAEVVVIGLDNSGKLDMSALEAALQSPEISGRPKLGSFSACSNVTGIRTDTRAVATLLHRHGAYACFDFACSGPYEDIDMRSGEEDGYDAVFLSPHKFLGGPGSPGILLMSNSLYFLKGGPPSTSGGGTVDYVSGHNEQDILFIEQIEEREDAGTPPIVQKLRAAFAFAVKSYAGSGLIRHQEETLQKYAYSRLSKNPRIRVLGENHDDNQPIFSFLIYPDADNLDGKHLHHHFTSRLLNDLFGIQSRGGCACAGPYRKYLLGISEENSIAIRSAISQGWIGLKPGFTRVSFPYYTTVEEMEFVLDAMDFISEMGHLFLPLYHFDWRTGAWEFKDDDGILSHFTEPCLGILQRCGIAMAEAMQCFSENLSLVKLGFPRCHDLQEYSPLFGNRGSTRRTPTPPYAKYLQMAREMAEVLKKCGAKMPTKYVPQDVDSDLITFIT